MSKGKSHTRAVLIFTDIYTVYLSCFCKVLQTFRMNFSSSSFPGAYIIPHSLHVFKSNFFGPSQRNVCSKRDFLGTLSFKGLVLLLWTFFTLLSFLRVCVPLRRLSGCFTVGKNKVDCCFLFLTFSNFCLSKEHFYRRQTVVLGPHHPKVRKHFSPFVYVSPSTCCTSVHRPCWHNIYLSRRKKKLGFICSA